ncbi:DUF4362 domain-containing protein [Neobacillus sp. SuZ13]|uniref:DUF4362 domain-containing protein n=1 Tax=Neobacillus sp. SuZ13 TaxID=3047875 RepID=UPI0024BF43CC|nr:DUF4362 domain-containing protein [Neobacillus sp. SuZ13]WHY66813.1 DUF4362 domain-containing protein [Neobacillus sp. SuZ13]
MKIKGLFVFSTVLLLMLLIGCQQSDNPKKPYRSEEAIKNGDIVNAHGKISNLEKFNLFIEHVNKGVKDKVRITSYTIEGDPIFYNLDYNGKEIKYTYDASQDSYGASGKQSATCSDIVSSNNENGVEYHLSKCSSDVGNTFNFQVPNN